MATINSQTYTSKVTEGIGNLVVNELTYVFDGTEPSGTIVKLGRVFGHNRYLKIRVIPESGIATTSANIGYLSRDENNADDTDYFAAAASLASDAVVLDMSATVNKEVDFKHDLVFETTTAAVAGNAGLTIKFVIEMISKAP